MKKVLSVVMVVVLMLTAVPFSGVFECLQGFDFFTVKSSAANEDCLWFSLNDDEESYMVSSCSEDVSGEIAIPAVYNGLPVISIGSFAFYNCCNLTSIKIPDNVTSIGERAFYNCCNLTSIKVPDNVTSIGDYAFEYCSSLTSIEIPDSVTSMGHGVFADTAYYCNVNNWENGNVLYLGNYLIYTNSELSGDYVVKNGTVYIASNAFSYCDDLTSVTVPSSVRNIGENAFTSWNDNLVIYSKANTETAAYAKKNGLRWINNCTHNNTENRAAISAVQCSQFGYTSGTICCDCGEWISGHEKINPHIDTDHDYICDNCSEWIFDIIPGESKEIIVGAGETTLFEFTPYKKSVYVFVSECESDTRGNLYDADMNRISYANGYSEWENLELRYTLEAGKTYYYDISFSDSDENGTINVSFSSEDPFTYTLNDDGNSYSFSACDRAYSGDVVIPSTYNGLPVTAIDENAFDCCTSVTAIIISGGVTTVGDLAFANCSKLEYIEIPASVMMIGKHAFMETDMLETIDVSEDNQYYSVQDGVLFDKAKTELIFCTLPKSGAYTVPNTVTEINSYSFYFCRNITSVTIPSSVKRIGKYAFFGCRNMDSITVSHGITHIGESAFNYTGYYNNSENWETAALYIGEYLVSVNKYLIEYADNEFAYKIKDGTSLIANNVFEDSENLTILKLPTSVKYIGDNAFDNCQNLSNLEIPDGVINIGEKAFINCTSLVEVTIPDSVTNIGDFAFGFYETYEEILIRFNGLTISSNPNTAARTYADANGISWVALCAHHNTKNNVAVAAKSCSQPGYTEGVYCLDCGKWISGHEAVTIAHTDADCNYICEMCNSQICDIIPDVLKSVNIKCDKKVFLEFTPYETGLYEFKSVSNDNTYGYLYDADMNIIFKNVFHISEEDLNFSIKTMLNAGETYYLNVRFSDINKEGSFNVLVSAASPFTFELQDDGESYALTNCHSAVGGDLVIPAIYNGKPVTRIDDWAFASCEKIKEIAIPEGVTSIGELAFCDCFALTSVKIPTSVTNIACSAFEGCNGNVVVYSKQGAFAEIYAKDKGINWCNICKHLHTENRPAVAARSCSQPGYSAGVYCPDCDIWLSGHEEISVPHIDANRDYICENCSAWLFDIIPEETKEISVAEGEMVLLKFIPYVTDTYIFSADSDSDTYGHLYDADMNELASDDDSGAYNDFKIIYTLEAGKVYYFGAEYLYSNIAPFTVSLNVNSSFEFALNDDGDSYTLSKCYDMNSSKIVIPATYKGKPVTSIGIYAFYSHYDLESVEIPNSVTSIGESAFLNCSNLGSVRIPNSVTSIGAWAFCGCETITTLVIPDSVMHIGYEAFTNCTNLTTVTIPDSVTSIDDGAFVYSSELVIYGFSGSAAETFAKNREITFKAMNILAKNFVRIDYANKCIFSEKTINSLDECLIADANINLECVKSYSDKIGTDAAVNVKSDNTIIDRYSVIVIGDLDGDSYCDVLDAVLAERAVNGHVVLSDAQSYAANNAINTEIDAQSYQNVVNRALSA